MHDQTKRLTILSPKDYQTLYDIPHFTPEERDVYFSLDSLEIEQLKGIRHVNAAVYYLNVAPTEP